MSYQTEQEKFWAGEFGESYIQRNDLTPEFMAGKLALWGRVLRGCRPMPHSILELGANIGGNLRAIHALFPAAALTGVEINSAAAAALRDWGVAEVVEGSLYESVPKRQWEFVFTAGVLIHLKPEMLPATYRIMEQSSSRYVCMIEYYNPTPVALEYRGHTERLYKRDFAGDFLDACPDFVLRDYGFTYHREAPGFDDLNWFVMERC
ncbi:MAG: pseudaminic acid biosynthesis-associated methylase [Deltaproteobacteria bacterium]|nr:pseudaminic acid biosynthesis-associated methylase [Deltaproteobacteria bacterium]